MAEGHDVGRLDGLRPDLEVTVIEQELSGLALLSVELATKLRDLKLAEAQRLTKIAHEECAVVVRQVAESAGASVPERWTWEAKAQPGGKVTLRISPA